MTDNTYNPMDEIDSLTCDIIMEELKIESSKRMIEYYKSKKEFLIQAMGILKE